MRNIAIIAAVAIVGAAAVSCQDSQTASPKYDTKVVDQKVTTLTATVEKVNVQSRYVTVRGASGNVFTFLMGPDVRNLAQVEVGDKVAIKYYESVAVRIAKPGERVEDNMQAESMRPPEGERPGGAVGTKVTTTAKIISINRDYPCITLRTKEGVETTVTVRDRERLKDVKVGEDIVITYTEGVAVSVEPAE